MRTLRRITLLGTFAAVGVGLAICVGSSAPPQSDRSPLQPPRLAARVATDVDPDAGCSSVPPLSAPRSAPVTRPVPPRMAAMSLPEAPMPVEPLPRRAQQFVPAPEKPRLEQMLEMLRQELGPEIGPDAGAAGSSSSAPPGAGTAIAAEPGPAPAPPGTSTSADGGAAAVPPPAPPAAAKGTVAGDGDGQLVVHFPDNDIREVLDMLAEQGGLNILASRSVQGKVSASLSGVDVQTALDAILKSTGYLAKREGNFIFVGTPEDFSSIEQAIDKIGTRVYRPNYITAAELQKLIEPLLTEKTGVVTVSSPAEVGIAADATAAGGDSFAGSDVVVVRDYQAVLAQVDQMVAEVDVRPPQVHIEAMILSIKLADNDKYGVNFQLLRDSPNIKFGLGAPPSSLANFTFQDGALKFGFLDSSLGAFLSFLETVGDTNVIATPRLMVINKHRAEIQIGEQKGYVNTTVTETSSAQSVEFLDVGAIVRLRPFISSDGLIRMEIHPELSDGSVTTTGQFTLPEKEVTQVTTNIMVRDGCTVVIGGLMRENVVVNRQQIPVLGNLPLIGIAFRNSDETVERREILVLITPHIVYEPGTCQEGEKAACEFHRRQAVVADKMTVLNRQSIARRYFRLAQAAWAAGDGDRALRYSEMAVQFDPTNRAAIDLRSAIWQGRPYGDHTLQPEGEAAAGPFGPSDVGPKVDALDRGAMPQWLLDQLQSPPGPPATLHPLDPGQPGRHRDIPRPERLQ